MSDIYTQHDAAFAQVSAYAILRDGESVAKIAIKYPRDGAGRLYAYVHWYGLPMVRGQATGYGYDKRTAACANAVGKLDAVEPCGANYNLAQLDKFIEALKADRGPTFDSALRDAGFTVIQAI